MIILKMKQSSQEWLDFRDECITSSDSSSIMRNEDFPYGMNQYCSIHELWERKHGFIPPKIMDDKMLRGQTLEPIAREILNKKTGIDFQPAVALHHIETWCMASLDGLSPCEQYICEIKCPNDPTHELAIAGQLKPYYYCQVQHQLYVTDATACHYCSYFPGHRQEMAIIKITPNHKFIADLVEQEKYFYENNMLLMEPTAESWKFKEKVR